MDSLMTSPSIYLGRIVPPDGSGAERFSAPEPPVSASGDAVLGAEGGVATGADLGLRGSTVSDDVLDLRRHDRLRVEQDGRDVPVAGLVVDGPGRGRLLALDEADGQLRERPDLLLGGLVDRHALAAVQDVLQTLDGRVLTRDRNLAGDVVL